MPSDLELHDQARNRPSRFRLTGWLLVLATACGFRFADPTPFVDRIVKFEPGEGAGFGQDKLPDIVLGPPRGHGKLEPSDHVLSLGKGGRITLEFVDNEVIDEDGPDLLIFENAFLKAPGDDPGSGFFELAKVEVSLDGVEWREFKFDILSRKGCAGHHPVLANPDENEIDPTDPEKAGGDPFDLKDVGLPVIRFVRITDLGTGSGANGTAGFDLDAVSAVHSRPRKAE
ncbi:MAG: cell surface protein [Planctomycetes bacterium]|nr:cell surface protein [Planctomycetota bacterium]